jgi:hypothetical protein
MLNDIFDYFKERNEDEFYQIKKSPSSTRVLEIEDYVNSIPVDEFVDAEFEQNKMAIQIYSNTEIITFTQIIAAMEYVINFIKLWFFSQK